MLALSSNTASRDAERRSPAIPCPMSTDPMLTAEHVANHRRTFGA